MDNAFFQTKLPGPSISLDGPAIVKRRSSLIKFIKKTSEKFSIFSKFKEDEDFNHMNTLCISRIKI